MRWKICGSVLLLMALQSGLAHAQQAPEWKFCDSKSLGTPDERIRNCTALIESRRESPHDRAVAYNNRGNVYDDRGDNDRAIADYNEAIRLDPKYAKAYNNRGYAYSNKKDYVRAIADYNEAIRLDPTYAKAFHNRGNAYQEKGEFDRAIADFSEAIRLEPKNADYLNDRCWVRAVANRELPLALADCNASLRLTPNDETVMDSRGLVYLRLTRFDDAIFEYTAALKIKPKLASSLYGRGLAKIKQQDTAGGNADIAAAKALQSDIAEEFAKYGVTLATLDRATPSTAATPAAAPPSATPVPTAGDCSQAEAHWKGALALDITAGYEDHLKRFPNCAFADLARLKIAALRK